MVKVPSRLMESWQDPVTTPYVQLKRVTRKYGDVYAVDDVSLDVYQGEFFSLLGSSG
jgi:putrescine transport system ATP-binding protein